MSLFSARGSDLLSPVGQHHWALRMGSGWDPRPTPANPTGTQVGNSAVSLFFDTTIYVWDAFDEWCCKSNPVLGITVAAAVRQQSFFLSVAIASSGIGA